MRTREGSPPPRRPCPEPSFLRRPYKDTGWRPRSAAYAYLWSEWATGDVNSRFNYPSKGVL